MSNKDREILEILSSYWLLRNYSVPWLKVKASVNIHRDFVTGFRTCPNTELWATNVAGFPDIFRSLEVGENKTGNLSINVISRKFPLNIVSV
jgi:hypothetical protein